MSCLFQPLRSKYTSRACLRTAALALAVLSTGVQSAQAQTLKPLHSFRQGSDGILPTAGVIRDAAGNLYGTTSYGGAFGAGTVFKLSKDGETVLYSFRGKTDGGTPQAGVIEDASGNLFGTTETGGNLACNNGNGCGTVFKLDTTGKERVLHEFGQSTTDGQAPVAPLVRDANGNFYGTTVYGGGTSNSGTVFKLDPTGKETVLYSFTGGNGGADGANPVAGVTRDAAGNLYGTTPQGGPSNTGIVFELDVTGKETVLYTFTGGNGGTDGKTPMGSLVRDAAGNLYGTTQDGGTLNGGTIFKVDPTGKETVLFRFSKPTDGANPQSGMTRDAAGNLYGTTTLGGAYGDGVVFKLDTAGNETVLASFGGSNGQYPTGHLALNASSQIYGVSAKGGRFGWGTIFTIIP